MAFEYVEHAAVSDNLVADNPAPIDAPNPEGTNRQRKAFAFLRGNSAKIVKLAVLNEAVETRQMRRARERAAK